MVRFIFSMRSVHACLAIACSALATAAPDSADALELGTAQQGYAELASKQVPLPGGEWTVVGRGTNSLISGEPGAYGTIENAILAQRVDGRVQGLVEINVNRLPVSEGWGTAADCGRKDALATIAFYKTQVDGFCLFVVATEVGTPNAPGPKAWETVRPLLHEGQKPPSPVWLTVGYRVSDRNDIVDVRYHLDPSRLGLRPLPARAWTVEAVVEAPERYAAVNRLSAWGGLAAGLVEDGFHGALATKLAGHSLPNPWDSTAMAQYDGKSPAVLRNGRASKQTRIAALDTLVEAGAISAADHEVYLKAIENESPPPTPDDYYRLLGAKVVSFNFFRVSVDYILAYIVTVSNLVSGYITASIVATHSVAQVFNDMWWDNYITAQLKAKSGTVDFVYIGVRQGKVS